ncbi:ComF family protein [Desulfatirhabdium butyrativorans]|uniref:ComF family protein n=1 Tax=Desulfatirhabdium butyrativorans TaxID=340467 RepID=UPI000688C974|nr:ComF family protein [Desulfatirhabdium butyrativorans]
MRWLQIIADVWREAFFPAVCVHCRRFLHLEAGKTAAASFAGAQEDVLSVLYCPSCLAEIRWIRSPKCSVCGIPFWGAGETDHVCGNCEIHPRPFVSAEAVAIYEGPIRSAIHALKYDGRLRVARVLGRSLYLKACESGLRRTADLIIPVPLHPVRLRKRGFNQSILLVQEWDRFLDSDMDAPCRPIICREALQRIRNTRPQMSLGKKERQTNIVGAFKVNRDIALEGKRILLVDDVLTTGATVAECTQVLLKAGAAKVDVLTAARTIE